MKTLLYIATLLLLMSCGQKSNNSTTELMTNQNNSTVTTSNMTESEIEFKKHNVDGIFLKGTVRIFDNNLKMKEKLEVDKITPVQVLDKSTRMFNIEGNRDNCEKAYFLKVKYRGKEYTVFGQDVYEINYQQRFCTQNSKNEKLVLFPITSFKMGAEDENGLTDCMDFSYLMLFNEAKKNYSLMKYPKNEDIHGESTNIYASLFHDDGSEEKIYKLTVKQDTLVIGIKAIYQEGGSVFNLKVKLSGELPETIISDRIRFDTEEELKKMDEFK